MKPRTLFVAIAVALGVLVVGLPSVLDPAVTTKSPGSTPNGVPPPKAGATDGDVDGKGSQTIRRPAENRSHHCLNDDFAPEHAVGIWTMLSDNPDYVKGAVKMGRSVRRHTKTPHDLVVMEIESKPLGKESWDLLSSVGFKRCSVKSIPPPKPDKTRRDLREKFGVLHVWAMTVYDTVLFIDADTFVQNGLDDLLGMDLEGKTIGVTKDIRAKKWVDTFNSGVLLLHPSAGEYDRLHKLLYSGMEFEYIMSDQGFLNEVYKDDWKEIGFVNNANLALYRFQRAFWDEHKLEDINIVHYTMQKPWKCQPRGPYGPICKLWIDAE
ncbi:hypothetical protein ACHAWF_005159 [Thalassiosira exigua]